MTEALKAAALPHPVPPVLLNPSNLWVFNWLIPVIGTIIILRAIHDSIRHRRLTWSFLFLFNSMLVYWMETIGDWGQHLIYSPAFATHNLLDWLPVKTTYDPVFIPFAYALYWTFHAWVLLLLGDWLVRRTGWSMMKAIIVLAIPVNYVWDFLNEGAATYYGWWTYDPGIGPVLEWPSGGRITLLWTIGMMCTWPNLIAYWGGKPPVAGLNHIERMCGLQRFTRPKAPTDPALAATPREKYEARLNYEATIPLWRFETYRLLAWILVFNISFFLFLVLPLLLMRLLPGHASPWLPPNF